MEPIFEIAATSDIDLLLQFMREYYEFDHLPFDERIARVALEKILRDDTLGRVWLIQDSGEAVGYVVLTLGYSLEYHGRDAFIDEIYIRESHRGRGLGMKAINFVEDVCRNLDVQALHLEVERANKSAQAFYHKVGFEDHERFMLTKKISSRK